MSEEMCWQVIMNVPEQGVQWLNYPANANAAMVKAYDAGAETCKIQLKIEDRVMDYTINFAKNKQIADYSGKERTIRPPYESPWKKAGAPPTEVVGENVKQKEDPNVKKNAQIAEARKIVKEWMDKTKETKGQSEEKLMKWREGCNKAVKEVQKMGLSEEELRPLRDRLRKIHNSYLDLKGNIRVYIRTRPFNQREKDMGAKLCYKVGNDGMTLTMENDDGEKNPFMFDNVFNPGKQEEVFAEVKDLIQSVYDGYNVTIFAYGQTGSGKTYTMYGPKDQQGIVPRCMHELFRLKPNYDATSKVEVKVSMLELYCARMTDLLAQDVLKPAKITVRNSPGGEVIMENLSESKVSDPNDLEKRVQKGFDNRQTAATAMNAESSRSHLLLTIRVAIKNNTTGQEIKGKLTLIDLAGSERVKQSNVTGAQLTEAVEINKSLTALGDCFQALTTGAKNAGFRNHLLTQLLADSLGGSAKTLMFANISPANTNYGETIMTCKWAERAKKVVNNAGKVDKSPASGGARPSAGPASPKAKNAAKARPMRK